MILGERYRVLSTLAQGGTSTVYLCEDLRLPGARWAVKLADPTALGPGASVQQLFDREAELLTRLSHPVLPRLVDRFQHEGQPALVLEALEGQTLARRPPRNPRLLAPLIDLLEAAHRQEILLIDLSPSNLLLGPDGKLRLVDLGLARVGPGPAAGGTPGFTAPEATRLATPASDVYALGALLRACRAPESLISRCLHPDPAARPGLAEVRRLLSGAPALEPAVPRSAIALASLLLFLSLLLVGAGLVTPPAPAEPLAREAWRALLAGDRPRAAVLARRLAESDPEDPEARILLYDAALPPNAPRLPLVVPVTGAEHREGRAFLQGAALAQAQSRSPLFLQVCDDEGQIERAMQWVQELGQQPEVACILGPTNSERALAVELVAQRARVPVLSLGASHPRAWQNSGWLFTVGVPFEPRVAPLAADFAARHFQRAWLLYDPQQVLARDLSFAIKDRLGPVQELPFANSTRDFRSQVATLVAQKADGVFFVAAPGSYLGEFAVQLRAAGSQAALYSNVSGYEEGLHQAGGPALDGLRLSETFYAGSEDSRAFVQAFQQLFPGVQPSRSSAQAYDAVRLVQGTEREELHRKLQALEGYPGVSGAISTARLPEHLPVYLMEVRDGHEALLRREP